MYPMDKLIFDGPPQQLGESASYSERQFEHIPIYCPKSKSGFGDIAATVKLARGLRGEFPEKKVDIYFEEAEDCQKADNFLTNEERDNYGLELSHKSEKGIRHEMEMAVVGISSVINSDFDGNLDDLLTAAAVNFYIGEYDSGALMPAGMVPNQVYTDYSGRKHIILRTGFHPDSTGIHIDQSISALGTKTKPELLEELEYGNQIAKLPEIFESLWTVLYNSKYHTWNTISEDPEFLQLLYKDLLEVEDTDRRLIVFDFTAFDRGKPSTEPFVRRVIPGDGPLNVWEAEIGRVRGVPYDLPKTEPLRNVTVVNIGPQPSSIFFDFLKFSEDVVGITGDVSLAEAVSLDKLWTYKAHRGKVGLLPNFMRLTYQLLEKEDAERMQQLLGDRDFVQGKCFRERMKSDQYGNFGELRDFYTDNREQLLNALSTSPNNTTSGKIEEIVIEHVGREEMDKLQHYVYAIKRAIMERTLADEIVELEHIHSHSISAVQRGWSFNGFSKLFHDKELQNTFHRMNQALVKEMDLAKNLAELMTRAVEVYQEEGGEMASWSKLVSRREKFIPF